MAPGRGTRAQGRWYPVAGGRRWAPGFCPGWVISSVPRSGTPWAPPPCPLLLLQFVVDATNPTQVSASCVQLLSVLTAAPLAAVPVLILFNKM